MTEPFRDRSPSRLSGPVIIIADPFHVFVLGPYEIVPFPTATRFGFLCWLERTDDGPTRKLLNVYVGSQRIILCHNHVICK